MAHSRSGGDGNSAGDIDPQIRGAFKQVGQAFQGLTQQLQSMQQSQLALTQAITVLQQNGGGGGGRKPSAVGKFIETLHAIAALIVAMCLVALLLYAFPMVKEKLDLIVKNSDRPEKMAAIVLQQMSGASSRSDNGLNPPVLLTHAIMLRLPAWADDQPGAADAYEELHAVLGRVGGWNRWRIERKSDRDDDADGGKIASKFMYFVALAPSQVKETVAQLQPVLQRRFASDHMLVTVSLSDSQLLNLPTLPPPRLASPPRQ